MFVATVMFAVFVQPFAGSVTVTVYVPEDVTLVEDADGVDPAGFPAAGPSQAYVTPPVVEVEETVTVGDAHVMV